MRSALLLLLPAVIGAQTQTSFDAASIKPDSWPGNGFVGIRVLGNTLRADHTSLYGLVEFAYDLRNGHLSGGPEWAKPGRLDLSEIYQVIAKTTAVPPPPMEQFRLMLQALLADRFRLQVHHVEKDLPTYNLVVAPRGLRMKQSSPETERSMKQDARVNAGKSIQVSAAHISMDSLVENLGGYSGRPVFNRTGLDGFYDFELAWDADTDTPGPQPFGLTFVEAVEKLGLKLEPGIGRFDTVVIDHAERPTAN
jgi:uncharacterized protein (TIGR03435 family)